MSRISDIPSDSILIVTVTKIEANAVLDTFSEAASHAWSRRVIGRKIYYDLGIHAGVPVFMVQSEMGTSTPGGALLTVRQAIEDLHPQAVIMVGIAFGVNPEKQNLGDILVARQIVAYETGRIEEEFTFRGDRLTSSPRLLDKFRSGDNDWTGAKVTFGLVLSGTKLVTDKKFRTQLLKLEPETIGGEMEGAGVYVAASETKVDWIVVKAICDWADGTKHDNAQQIAAHNAAQFVLHVLQLSNWGEVKQFQAPLTFNLMFNKTTSKRYLLKAISSFAQEADAEISNSFAAIESENFYALQIYRPQQTIRGSESHEIKAAQEFGIRLFKAIFPNQILELYRASLKDAQMQQRSLRLRLHIASELSNVPWEYLYDPDRNEFISLSKNTPVIRYFDSPQIRPLWIKIDPPLRILVVISNPKDLPSINIEYEWRSIKESLERLITRDRFELTRLENATVSSLQHSLRRGDFHILHFIGHGSFDSKTHESGLLFEGNDGKTQLLTSSLLGTILRDQQALRLVILNHFEGARSTADSPFSNTAQKLVQLGIPSVIAMQFPITDRTASIFTQEFYTAIAEGYSVDSALAEARKAIYVRENNIQWGAPVLYTSVPDTQFFEITRQKKQIETITNEEQIRAELERSRTILKARDKVDALILLMAAYSTKDEIGQLQKEAFNLPVELVRQLDADTSDALPSLLSIAQDISSAQRLDLYGQRMALRDALKELETIQNRLQTIFGGQSRWSRVIHNWQNICLVDLNKLELQGASKLLRNPYEVGLPLRPDRKNLFKGRLVLRDAVVLALRESSRPTLVLTGPRRMGKTSFLLQLPALLPGKTIPVFVDLQKPAATSSDASFLYNLSTSIARDANTYLINAVAPERTRFDTSPFDIFDIWLYETLLPRLQENNLLFCFDEFEKVGKALSDGKLSFQVLDQLRHIIQHQEQIALLFAGVQTLDDLGPNWSSYFINVRSLSMDYLEQSEAEALIREPDPDIALDLTYEPSAVKRILDDTLGHPYLVQLVCFCIIEQANLQQEHLVNVSLVESGELLAFERGEPYFRNVWDEMAAADGQELLRQIAATKEPFPIASKELVINKALERMVRLKVLTKHPDGYTVEVPLIREWINKRAPL